MLKWKRKRKRERQSAQADPHVHRAGPPKKRLKRLIELPGEVAQVAESAVIGMPLPTEEVAHALIRFDLAMLARGTNALRAVRLLCGDGHWESAAGIVRQLFELVLNLEYLDAQPQRYQSVLRYARFGLLQMLLRRKPTIEYDRKTDRPTDSQEEAWVDAMLASPDLADFRHGKAPGRWAQSWCGKTTKQLAYDSPRPIRKDQYELLFRQWSEEAHGSPGALMASMFPAADFERIIEADDVRIAETVGTAVGLFLDLHRLLPAIPPLPPDRRKAWLEELLADAHARGAVPPGKPLVSDAE